MISPKPKFDGEKKGAIEYCSIDWFLTLTINIFTLEASRLQNESDDSKSFIFDFCLKPL